MIGNIIRIYNIGKDLGLNKREMKEIFLLKKHRYVAIILLFLIIIITSWAIYLSLITIISNRSTYSSGGFYSSVRNKDFRFKKNKKWKYMKK